MAESVYGSLGDDLKRCVDEKVELTKSYWMTGQYDFCIINCEEDQEVVNQFRDDFCAKYKVLGVVECDPQMSKTADYFDRIEEMVQRSTYVFLYISNNFGKDRMCLRHRSDLLTRFIEDKSLSLIPIYTKAEYVAKTPSGLRGVTGFKLFVKNQDTFRIKSTFSEQARMRRMQRERIEENELKLREEETRERLARELLERRRSSQLSDAGGPVTSTDVARNITNVGSANNMHIGNVININVINPEDASIILEKLRVSDDENC